MRLAHHLKPAFAVPGDDLHEPYLELAERDELVRTNREDTAAYAAIGAAEVSNEPAALLATRGPGLAHALPGLACALADHVPILCITGEPLDQGFQSLLPSLESNRARLTVTRDPREAARALARSQPAVLTRPQTPDELEPHLRETRPPQPTDGEIEEVRRRLQGRKVALLVGRGCYRARATEHLERLAERLNAPIVQTMRGRGVVPEYHPRNYGVVGLRGWANHVLREADVILALGARLTERTLPEEPDAEIIAVTLHLNGPADLHLECDPAPLLRALLKHPPETRPWRPERREPDEPDLHAYRVVKTALRAWIGPVTLDSGQHTPLALLAARLSAPNELIHSGAFCPVGFALPAALGAATRTPEPVLAITGDGGFLATHHELETVVREDLPVTVLVLRNRELGFTRQTAGLDDPEPAGMDLPTDPADLAEAYGTEVHRLEHDRTDELHRILRDAEMQREPTVIVVELPREDVPLPDRPG